MGELILVRHGQANSAATTEEDYDRLSDIGHRQARVLGDWLSAHEGGFDRVLSGTLRRHLETARGMGVTPETDPRLNEMDYYTLGRALREAHGVPFPDADGFADHAPKVMAAWERAEIEGQESFAQFEARVTDALIAAGAEGRRTLVVTSGGVIAMVMRHILGLDTRRLTLMMLPILNTSLHRVHIRGANMLLAGFNAAPHLDAPTARDLRTHY